MKRINKILQSSLLLAALVGLSACTEETEIIANPEGGTEQTDGLRPRFKLSVAPIERHDLNKETRTTGTAEENKESAMQVTYGATQQKPATRGLGEISEDAEEEIHNVWVFHYNGTDDEAKLLNKEYITEIGSDYIIQPNLSGKEEVDPEVNQTICFLANTNNASLSSPSSLGSFKKRVSRAYENQLELTNNGLNLPMAAMYEGKINTAIKEIKMVRMVAKVSFTYQISLPKDHHFEVKALQLQDCRKTIFYAEPTAPEEKVNPKKDYVDYDMIAIKPGTEVTWYLAENIRGEVEGVKFPHQKGGASAPECASNIQIYGYYTRPTSSGTKETFPVVYRVYIGTNATTSFDVKRNHHYSIGATISNARTTDKRVVLPNVALSYLAETNLKGLGEFVTKEDESYPHGAFWQWGRNIPFKDAGLGGYTEVPRAETSEIWTDKESFYYAKDYKRGDTWQSIIKRQAAAGAPEEYVGKNANYMGELTGDPCPQGYHLPTSDEMRAFVAKEETTIEKITVRGVTGEYRADIKTGSSGYTYGIKFLSANTWNYVVACRWHWEDYNPDTKKGGLTITARYLGQAARKLSISNVSKPDFWEKNREMDVVRFIPAGYYSFSKSKSENQIKLQSGLKLFLANTYHNIVYGKYVYQAASVFVKSGRLSYDDKHSELTPIRCMQN